MPETIERFTVFLASPGDVAAERKAVADAVEEINRTFGEPEGFVLTLKRWETHTRPATAPKGGSSQDVIDAQIGPYDIFVGLMWTKFGTPTKTAGSGTEQEYEAARKAGRRKRAHPLRMMFYFRSGTAKVRSIDPDQLKAVLAFKARVFEDHLARDYDTPKQFAGLIRVHLTQEARALLARKRVSAPTKKPAAPAPAPSEPAAPVKKRAAPRTTGTKTENASTPKKTRGPKPLPTTPVRKLLTDKDRERYARRVLNSLFLSISRTAADFQRAHAHATLTTTKKGASAFEVQGQVEGYEPVHFRVQVSKDQWRASWAIELLAGWKSPFGGETSFQTVTTVLTTDDDFTPTLAGGWGLMPHGGAPLTAAAVASAFWKRINDALGVRR